MISSGAILVQSSLATLLLSHKLKKNGINVPHIEAIKAQSPVTTIPAYQCDAVCGVQAEDETVVRFQISLLLPNCHLRCCCAQSSGRSGKCDKIFEKWNISNTALRFIDLQL